MYQYLNTRCVSIYFACMLHMEITHHLIVIVFEVASSEDEFHLLKLSFIWMFNFKVFYPAVQ
jgi:hypothetical protein